MSLKQLKERGSELIKSMTHYNGDKSTLGERIDSSRVSESIGTIRTVLTVNNTVYAIIKRDDPFDSCVENAESQYYHCKGQPSSHTPYELFMPLLNIHLDISNFDPRILVGRKALVKELGDIAVKAEYIGQVNELNESPINIPRTVLASIRNYIGPNTKLDSKDDRVKEQLDYFDIEYSVFKSLSKHTLDDWDGQVIRFKSDAVSYRDTVDQVQGEIIVDDRVDALEGLIRHIESKDMKTKKCHMPINLFSAR